MTVTDLNDHFGIPGRLTFDEEYGVTRAQVRLASAEATIYLHGAHLTHWQPTGQAPALFLSSRSEFAPGKAIRGGVPICFPWFGARSDSESGPSHGFARISDWELAFAALLTGESGDRIHLTFALGPSKLSRSLGYDQFRVAYEVIIGPTLTLRLTVANLGSHPLRFEEALHAYFAVADVRQTTLGGLESAIYRDKTDAMREKTAPNIPLQFIAETDRVYPANNAPLQIDDPIQRRNINIQKTNSATTVVWNPWSAQAAKLSDLDADAWPGFLCVEIANTATDAITLDPGATHTMQCVVSVTTA